MICPTCGYDMLVPGICFCSVKFAEPVKCKQCGKFGCSIHGSWKTGPEAVDSHRRYIEEKRFLAKLTCEFCKQERCSDACRNLWSGIDFLQKFKPSLEALKRHMFPAIIPMFWMHADTRRHLERIVRQWNVNNDPAILRSRLLGFEVVERDWMPPNTAALITPCNCTHRELTTDRHIGKHFIIIKFEGGDES
jgi:hypothetical protein